MPPVRVRLTPKAKVQLAGRYVGFREMADAFSNYGRSAGNLRRTGPGSRPAKCAPQRIRVAPRPQRSRQSHRLNAGHRATTRACARAGPDDGPGEPPGALWRHPRHGLVNDAMAAFLEAWS